MSFTPPQCFTPPQGCLNPNFCFYQSCPRTPRCWEMLGPPASAERGAPRRVPEARVESVLSDFIKQMGKARACPRKEEIPKPTEQPTGRPPSEQQFKPECSIEQLLYEADGCSTADYEIVLLREIIERLRAELVTVRGTPRPLDEFDPL